MFAVCMFAYAATALGLAAVGGWFGLGAVYALAAGVIAVLAISS